MNFLDKLIDGLQPFEVILLFLGVVLCLASIILFIQSIVKGKSPKPIFLFLVVGIAMIAWPSIAKIKIDADGVELEKKAAEYAANPTPEKKDSITTLIGELKERDVQDPEIQKAIARSQYVIGNLNDANVTLNNIAPKLPQDPSLDSLRAGIHLTQVLDTLTPAAATPDNKAKLEQLNKVAIKSPTLDARIRRAGADMFTKLIR